MASWVTFGVLAGSIVLSALLAVTSRRLVSSVLWLGASLAVTAALFVTLAAPLLGGLQLLLYVGGVMTLMLFGVMLTGSGQHESGQPPPWAPARAALVAIVLFGVLGAAIVNTPLPALEGVPSPTLAHVGEELLTTNLLAFEVLSFLLLAAMVGAIVLARKSDVFEARRRNAPRSEEAP
ncbi:MAG TPA: NADH-quinone oxidoreductase subunit J [Polyangiaceae bacterium]